MFIVRYYGKTHSRRMSLKIASDVSKWIEDLGYGIKNKHIHPNSYILGVLNDNNEFTFPSTIQDLFIWTRRSVVLPLFTKKIDNLTHQSYLCTKIGTIVGTCKKDWVNPFTTLFIVSKSPLSNLNQSTLFKGTASIKVSDLMFILSKPIISPKKEIETRETKIQKAEKFMSYLISKKDKIQAYSFFEKIVKKLDINYEELTLEITKKIFMEKFYDKILDDFERFLENI